MDLLTRSVSGMADRLLGLLVKKVDAAAACSPERWTKTCYCIRCGTTSPLVYKQTCYVTTGCTVRCTACAPAGLCLC